MHITCPQCGVSVGVEQLAEPEIPCPACGSTLHFDAEQTGAYVGAKAEEFHIDRFEILQEIGAGAFGTVYKARDPRLDRIVAVKVPRASATASAEERDRFLREARSAAQLRHPNIVTIFEVGEVGGVPYIVSDFVDGETLAGHIAKKRPDFRSSAEMVATLADALHYAHGMGVVHRDVKPSNVMIENAESTDEKTATETFQRGNATVPIRLMDFGLAKRDAADATLTVEGQVLGTPAYMSPEQARGEGHLADGRTDIYSLGALLYQLLTGVLPFHGNMRSVLQQVLNSEPRPPRHIDRRIPKDLETICLKAMAKDLAARYATAGELAADLRRFLRGEPIQARRTHGLVRLWRRCRRNPLAAGLAALTVVVLFILGASLLSGYYSRKNARAAFELTRNTLHESVDRNANLDDIPHEQRLALRDKVAGVVPLYEDFARLRKGDVEIKRELGRVCSLLGLLDATIGDWKRAHDSFAKAHAVFAALARRDAADPIDREYLIGSLINLALLSQLEGDLASAERQLREALSERRSLLQQMPEDQTVRFNAISDLDAWGTFLHSTNRPVEAEAVFREAIQLVETTRPPADDEVTGLTQRAACFLHLGMSLDVQGGVERCDEAFHTGLDALDQVLTSGMRSEIVLDPNKPMQSGTRRTTPMDRSVTLTSVIRRSYVIEVLRKPVDFYQRQFERSKRNEHRRRLARSQFFLGMMQLTHSKPDPDAERVLQQSFGNYDALVQAAPTEVKYRLEAARLSVYGGIIRMVRGEHEPALDWSERAIRMIGTLKDDADASLPRLRADAHMIRGNIRFRKDLFVGALADLDLAIQLHAALGPVIEDTILRIVFRAQEKIVRLMREGRFAEAVADAEVLAGTRLATGVALYEAACVISRAAAASTDAMEKEKLASRAVAVLREAFRRGFGAGLQSANAFRGQHPLDYMKKDTDLDGLRGRADYQQWLKEEEAKKNDNRTNVLMPKYSFRFS